LHDADSWVEDRESRVIKVTKAEWLTELLRAMWRQLGIEDIEKDDI